MRQIKFRVWSTVLRVYVPAENALRVNYLGELCGMDPISPIEQFTGLLDKNGKEIFEGDLLRRPSFETISAVVWEQEGARFIRRFGVGGVNIGSLEFTDGMEVIGNIHESPELLK